MSKNLIPFAFEGRTIRALTDELGDPLWVGKDICDALGYANHNDAMRDHCRGVAKTRPIPDALGRMQETRVLAEADVLRLIMRSNLPTAQKFEAWVTEEVLPSIRETGAYVAPNAQTPAVPTLYLEQSIELLQQSSEVHFRDLRNFREELDRFYDSLPQKMENIFKAASAKYAAEMKGVEILLEAADRRFQALEKLVGRIEKRLDRLEDRAAA